ncbi:MAG: PqqD family peptide modification chaperone [Sumerlaeia bacterium]
MKNPRSAIASLTLDAVLVPSPDQVASAMGGEVALLNIDTGVYYGLDGVGARVWDLIQQPRPLAEIRDILLSEYEVPPARLEPDLLALAASLLSEGLAELTDGHGD